MQNYNNFEHFDDCIRNISSRPIRSDPKLFETIIFRSVRKNFNVKYWIHVSPLWQFFKLLERFSVSVNSNISCKKIYWIKLNFRSKCEFKSDEDKNKQSVAPCEGIVKFRRTFFACLS